MFTSSIRMGNKKHLSDLVVGVRQAGVSEIADLLGFSPTIIYGLLAKLCKK